MAAYRIRDGQIYASKSQEAKDLVINESKRFVVENTEGWVMDIWKKALNTSGNEDWVE
jgi:hypothetical protein